MASQWVCYNEEEGGRGGEAEKDEDLIPKVKEKTLLILLQFVDKFSWVFKNT